MVLLEEKDMSKQYNDQSASLPEYLNKLTFIQKLIIRIVGHVKVNYILENHWNEDLSYYVYRCKKHGLQLGYTMGHKGYLMCPICHKYW